MATSIRSAAPHNQVDASGTGAAVNVSASGATNPEGALWALIPNDVPVYSARAVPFDPPREDPAQRAASIARALTATQTQAPRAEIIEAEQTSSVSGPTLLAEADRCLFQSKTEGKNRITVVDFEAAA